MGALFSKLRKSKTTIESLEEIDKDIAHLEKFRKANQELRQKIIGKLILYSVILYIIGAFGLYFFFMPQELTYKIYGLLPFILFPFLVYLLKRFLHWFFVRKISQNEEELQGLQDKRKDILENVMETETYKKAKEILEKFDPDTKRKIEEEKQKKEEETKPQAISPQPGLRRRQGPQQVVHPGSPVLPMGRGRGMPLPMSAGVSSQSPPNGFPAIPSTPVGVLPRPILPLNKTPLDKFMDYMIGDGATQRYALICRNCCSHNGMALKEEFQFMTYRCAYCRFLNPARKLRPNAPLLPTGPRRIQLDASKEEGEGTPQTSASEEASPPVPTVNEDRDSSAAEADIPLQSTSSTDVEDMDVDNKTGTSDEPAAEEDEAT